MDATSLVTSRAPSSEKSVPSGASPTTSRMADTSSSYQGCSMTSKPEICSSRIRGASMLLVKMYSASRVRRTSATPSGEAWSTRLSAPPVYQAKLVDLRSRSAPSPRRSISSRSPWYLDLRPVDRKSTRLNSSHANISYAVFCLKKKKKQSNVLYHHKKKKKQK